MKCMFKIGQRVKVVPNEEYIAPEFRNREGRVIARYRALGAFGYAYVVEFNPYWFKTAPFLVEICSMSFMESLLVATE